MRRSLERVITATGVTLLLVALVVFSGVTLMWREHEKRSREQTLETIRAVADLQTEKLDRWLRSRRAIRAPTEQSLHWASLRRDESGTLIVPPAVTAWGLGLARTFDFDELWILDGGRVVWASAPPADERDAERFREEFEASEHDLRSVHIDSDRHARLLLGFRPEAAPEGVSVLFALHGLEKVGEVLRGWPTPSRTAETVVAWRDGDQIRFLTPLQKAAGSIVSVPLGGGENDLLAAQALRGKVGLLRGSDYLGARVTGAAARVPGTEWILIAKQNDEEIAELVRDPRQLQVASLLASALAFLLLVIFVVQVAAARERRRSEQKFRAIFEHAPIPITISDGVRFFEANPAHARWYGYDRPTAGLGVADHIAPESLPALEEAGRRLAEHGTVEQVELTALRRDGSRFPVAVSAQMLDLPEGRVRVGFVMDLSAEKRAQETLRRARDHYRLILDNFPNPVWQSDTTGACVYFNRAWLELTGRSFEQEFGDGWAEGVHPDDLERCVRIYREAFEARRAFVMEYRLRSRDGTYRWLLDCGAPMEDLDGRFTGFLGSCYDIHDERMQAVALVESEARFRSVVESMRDALALVDGRGRIAYHNPALLEILGLDALPADATLDSFIAGPDRESIRRLLESPERGAIPETCRALRSDGSWRWIEVLAGRMSADSHVLLARDVTEKRMLEEAVERNARVESLGRLSATLAHEFNNVLMAILPFVETLRSDDEARAGEAAAQITSAVYRGKAITQEILRYTGTAQLDRRPLAVAPFLRDVATTIDAMAPAGIRLLCEVPPENVRILADAPHLSQALVNLATNAMHAMPEGGTLSVRSRLEEAPGRPPVLAIEVADSGSGIPPEALHHIFDPLFTTKKKGTGLGLAVVRQIVTAHEGEVTVQSHWGVGTTFRILLPAGLAEEEAAVEHREATVRMGPREVLVVEDDPGVAAGLLALLDLAGDRARLAASGAEAVEAIASALPDAVMLDVGLPDIEGTELFHRIRARHPSLPIVFSTGHLDRARLDPLLGLPRVGHVLKPYSLDDLVRALDGVTTAEAAVG